MPETRLLPALAMLLAAPLPAVAQGDAAPATDASELSVSVSDARLALMQLSAGTGHAQTDLLGDSASRAIYLQSGSATLEELRAALPDGASDAIVSGEDGLVAHLPIVVLQGAELTLSSGEHLALDRTAGAFILSLGRVEFDGAEVASTGGPHPEIEGYRPFIVGLGETSLALTDSRFEGLGYGAGPETVGVSLSGGGLLSTGEADPVTGNTFHDLRTVRLAALDNLEIADNRVEESRGTGLRLENLTAPTVTGNLILEPHGSEALHASDIGRGTIAGNRFEAGQGKGVRIDDRSRDLRVEDNSITGFDGSGVTVAEGASCILIAGNDISDNYGTGLSLRAAGTFIVTGNTMEDNHGPGLRIAGQAAESEGLVLANTFGGNRQGIRATELETLRLARNDLDAQMPRLMGGDLDQYTADWLKDRKDGGTASMVVEGVSARTDAPLRRDAADRAFAACSQTDGGV